MTCRICGADLPEGAMFCGDCGSSTSATQSPAITFDAPGSASTRPTVATRPGVDRASPSVATIHSAAAVEWMLAEEEQARAAA